MAKFKVGQFARIRANVIVPANDPAYPDRHRFLGREAKIEDIAWPRPDEHYQEVRYKMFLDGKEVWPLESLLEPLTPPNIADWASQKVKQVTKPEPVVSAPEKAKAA